MTRPPTIVNVTAGVEEVLEVTGTGDGTLTEVIADEVSRRRWRGLR